MTTMITYKIKCKCGTVFESEVSNAKYCSQRCRKDARNQKEQELKALGTRLGTRKVSGMFARKCHDCGRMTTNYRCNDCLMKWRVKNHVPMEPRYE